MTKENITEYPFTLNIRNNEIKYRKWKVKDKKNFIETIKSNGENIEDLIYECIENKDIALSEEEFKYVLINIRAKSLGQILTFDFTCSNCENDFSFDADLIETLEGVGPEYKKIKVDKTTIKIGEISNKDFYEDAIQQCTTEEQKYLVDFVYHIKEYNSNDGFTFEQAFDFVNNLDLDVGEEVFRQWESMRFKINDITEVQCPHCSDIQRVQFDELYGFFPEKWFE